MDDGSNFDLCECINSHQGAMQRLLNLLRQSQAYCNDNSCVDDFSQVPQNANNPMSSMYVITFVAFLAIISAILFGLPKREQSDGKPRGPSRDYRQDPPAVL